MARTLTYKLTKTIDFTYQNAQDLSTPEDKKTLSLIDTNLTSGTGKDKADRLFHDTRSLAAGAYEVIDMYDLAVDGGSAGEDSLGQALANLSAKALTIRNKNTTATNDLVIGACTAAGCWGSLFNGNTLANFRCGPGGAFSVEAPSALGITIADSTNHLLKIANSGSATIAYDIVAAFATAQS